MLDPEDPFEREVRWLAHLREGEDYHRRITEQLSRRGADASNEQNMYEAIRSFRLGVEAKLPPPHLPLPKVPSLWTMLEDIGADEKYLTYRILSQFTHGTH